VETAGALHRNCWTTPVIAAKREVSPKAAQICAAFSLAWRAAGGASARPMRQLSVDSHLSLPFAPSSPSQLLQSPVSRGRRLPPRFERTPLVVPRQKTSGPLRSLPFPVGRRAPQPGAPLHRSLLPPFLLPPRNLVLDHARQAIRFALVKFLSLKDRNELRIRQAFYRNGHFATLRPLKFLSTGRLPRGARPDRTSSTAADQSWQHRVSPRA
jgi:hypothetical protein